MSAATPRFQCRWAGTEPFFYQWRKDGLALVDGRNIAGALTLTLAVSNLLKSDEGGYSVVVSNLSGYVTSAVAQLIVVEWASWDTNFAREATGDVSLLAMQADGKILVRETNSLYQRRSGRRNGIYYFVKTQS